MAEDLTDEQRALYRGLVDVGRLLERRADQMMRATKDLTFTQYLVLLVLRNAGGEARMTEIATRVVATPSGVTYQVKQLEQLGLTERFAAPDDDRGILARITPRGRDMIVGLHELQTDMILDSVIDPFDREEVTMLTAMLGRLQSHLRKEIEPPPEGSRLP